MYSSVAVVTNKFSSGEVIFEKQDFFKGVFFFLFKSICDHNQTLGENCLQARAWIFAGWTVAM